MEGAESGQEQVPPACPPTTRGGDACSLIPSLCETVLLSRLRTSQLNCLAVLSQPHFPSPRQEARSRGSGLAASSPTPPFHPPQSAGLHDHAAVPRTFHTHRQAHRNTFHGSPPKTPLPQGNPSSPDTGRCLRADFQSGPWFPASKSGLHLDIPPQLQGALFPEGPPWGTPLVLPLWLVGSSLALGSERAGPGLGLQPLKGRP